MALQSTLRSRVRWGSSDGHTVGLVYAIIAFCFTTLHTILLPYFLGGEVARSVMFAPILGVTIAGNAYVWARFIWTRVPSAYTRSYGNAAMTGGLIGACSYITVGLVYSVTNIVLGLFTGETGIPPLDPASVSDAVRYVATWSVFFSIYGLFFTFGIPILLSVGSGVFIVWAERTATAS